MVDNTQLKDGLGNEFSLRNKDISAAQDGSLRRSMSLATLYPFDYGGGGAFHTTAKSSSMAAGLAAASPIFSFRWTSVSLLAVVKRVRLSAWSLGTGFAAGLATFDIFAARIFTVGDTGDNTNASISGMSNLRTSMAASAVGSILCSQGHTLTAGTRTLDPHPLDSWSVAIGTATNTPFSPSPIKLFEKPQGEHPLVLAANEGFVIRASVPATGVWSFAVTPEWDEIPIY